VRALISVATPISASRRLRAGCSDSGSHKSQLTEFGGRQTYVSHGTALTRIWKAHRMAREDLPPQSRDRGPQPSSKPIGSFGSPAAPTGATGPSSSAPVSDGKKNPTDAAAGKSGAAKAKPVDAAPRLVSLDAFRGFIMLAMASAGFQFGKVFANLNARGLSSEKWEYRVVELLKNQTDHVPWVGGVFWDLIQPAFMFMVGVALPYSYARRAAGGDSYFMRLLHTLFRAFVLVALGVFLANPAGKTSDGEMITNFIFPNVLAQIGLGYAFVFLFVNRGVVVQAAAIGLICAGSWYAFFQHPLRPEGFDYRTVGITAPPTIKVKDGDAEKDEPNPEFTQYVLPGLFAHWTKNANFAADVDRTLLNKFPRAQKPVRGEGESDADYAARVEAVREKAAFKFNTGGYTTLNFVPSMATMLLGLIIGELLRTGLTSGQKFKRMAIIGAVCIALGLIAGFTVCPIIKRIWTPSWALVSGGLVIWMLAGFYLVFDHWNRRRWAWPLVVVGMNSIVIYMMSQLTKGFTLSMLKTHLTYPYARLVEWHGAQAGRNWSPELFGGAANPYTPMWESAAVLFCFWLVCAWLWKQKIFVRI
jgi:heparan-alpha-glucosaminide N-acetyltransferase